ncbi:MAG: DUF6134 family protein [Pseudoruegeria sp.]
MIFKATVLTACFAAASFTSAASANVPDSGTLQFDVVRKGKDIGDISYVFQGPTANVKVQINTNVAVKVPLLGTKLYRFEQASIEHWQSGQLSSVKSKTNDNGDPHKMSSGATNLIPASLWNAKIVTQSRLLNTIDGSIMDVQFSNLGSETVLAQGQNIQATHYRMSGDLKRDLWFDDKGVLVRVKFKAEDGTDVTYIRK